MEGEDDTPGAILVMTNSDGMVNMRALCVALELG